ncbi:hypothetical protein GCM10011374_37040 [Kocuria dechangensis]|uniref:Uncharacterized protein n=1 Tax=Kocuria dechangensis TaxID=1176249 RepID=A0A917H6K2_9MICC|nr:hypothetical protein [Kocuria dechangensis]GGG69207.1 hypothetical protein GCM10011374_37040 [Kocuria dechangensis]
MLIALLKPFAALVLFVITAIRWRVVFDRDRSHAAWIGTLMGTLALSVNPFFITEYEIDALLGEHNWFHLMRNVLVLGAMWSLRVALLEALQEHPWSHQRKRLETAAAATVIGVMTFSFWSIDRSSTSMAFIPEHIDQLPTLVYGTAYMAAAAGLMFDTSWRIFRGLREDRRRRTRVRVALTLMCVGALSMGIASVVECFYMAADHLHATDGAFIVVTHAAFGPLYLSGAGLLAVGLLVLAASAAIRRWHLGDRFYLGRLMALRQDSMRAGLTVAVYSSNPRSELYEAMIATYDAEAREDIPTCPKRDKMMQAVEGRFDS